VRAPDPNH